MDEHMAIYFGSALLSYKICETQNDFQHKRLKCQLYDLIDYRYDQSKTHGIIVQLMDAHIAIHFGFSVAQLHNM